MGLVQVIIDDTASKTITGTYEFDRASGGALICPSGASFPANPESGEWFWRTDESKLYRYDGAAWQSVAADVSAHAATHESGGADVLEHQNLNGAGTNTHAQLDSHVASTSNPHSVTKAQVGLGNVTNDAQLKRAGNDFATFAEKISPDGADLLLIEDSAAAGTKKKVQVGNLPSSPSSVEVLESRITYQISTTSQSWVSISGLAITFTPKADEVVLVNFIGSLGSSGYNGERVKLDVQHNNSGSYQRISDRGRGLQYIESYVQFQEFPSAFSIAIALPNAVETTIVPVWRVDGAAGYLFGDYSALIFQVVRF